jgi:Tol biopolymer transport system component
VLFRSTLPNTKLATGQGAGGRGSLAPEDWSPDGKELLVSSFVDGGSVELAWVSVADGARRTILIAPGSAQDPRLSPDGRFIVFTDAAQGQQANRDIFIADTRGGGPRLLLGGPAHDRAVGWTPDGSSVVFLGNRLGSDGLWLLPVAEGVASGTPTLLRDNLGDVPAAYLSRGRSLAYHVHARQLTLFLGAMTGATGRVTAVSAPNAIPGAMPQGPLTWSPDGRTLVFGLKVGQRDYMAVSSADGTNLHLSSIDFQPSTWGNASWTADGKSVLLKGYSRDRKMAFHRFDVEGGTSVALTPPEDVATSGVLVAMTSDQRTYFKQVRDTGSRVVSLWAHSVQTGSDTELYRGEKPGYITMGSLSKDEQLLPFVVVPYDDSKGRRLVVLPTAGGPAREICPVQSPVATITWTADGRSLVFTQPKSGSADEEVSEVWQCSLDGSSPRKLDATLPPLSAISLHPDGRRIAYIGWITADGKPGFGKDRVWLLDNYLPPAPAKPTPKK